jgi:hypothetical protein
MYVKMRVYSKQVIVLENSFLIISISNDENFRLLKVMWLHVTSSHFSVNKEQYIGPDNVQWFSEYVLLCPIPLPVWNVKRMPSWAKITDFRGLLTSPNTRYWKMSVHRQYWWTCNFMHWKQEIVMRKDSGQVWFPSISYSNSCNTKYLSFTGIVYF